MFYLDIRCSVVLAGGGIGCCGEREVPPVSRSLLQDSKSELEKAKAIPQPGGLSSLLESQVVSFLWK